MARFLVMLISLCVLAVMASAQTRESGSFKFYAVGKQMGRERYQREKTKEGGWIVSGDNELSAPGRSLKQSFKISFDGQMNWLATELIADNAGAIQIVKAAPVQERLKLQVAQGKDAAPTTQELSYAPGTTVWASNIFSPLAQLAQRYDAKRGGLQLLGTILPNHPVELENKGKLEVTVEGRKQTVTKYLCELGKLQESYFWLDENGALVRYSLPAQGFVVVRDGAEKQAAAIEQAEKPKTVGRALPAGVRSEEVKFDSVSVRLAGTLLLPKLEAGKRAPAVLIIAGSGPTPRDGVRIGEVEQFIYRDLAEYLAGQGYAVLRYDKRCVGASTCKPKSSFDAYVDDARDAVGYLRSRAEIDPAKVFVLGHSEGGFIGSVVASNDDTLAGLVLAASPGRTMNKLLRDQLQARMKEAGKPEAEIAAFIAKLDRIVRALTSGVREGLAEQLDAKDPNDVILLSLVNQPDFVVPLLINDPLQIVNTVKVPVLILQGEKDLQVSVRDAQFLNEALNRAHHPDYALHLLPDVDHLLKTNKGAASVASYADATRPLDAKLLAILTEWLQKRVK